MAQTARLLFDSHQFGSMAGTRSPGAHERTLLFKAGSLSVDVFLVQPDGELFAVFGQVAEACGERTLTDARIRLEPGRELCRTDRYGQFSFSTLESVAGRSLRICSGERDVTCTLPEETVRGGVR